MPNRLDAPAPAIVGNVIRLGEGHQAAVYVRNGLSWVAEFHWSGGRLVDASTWFRFHSGPLRYCHGHRKAALDHMGLISTELREDIERLHQQANGDDAPVPRASVSVQSAIRRVYAAMSRGSTLTRLQSAIYRR